MDRKKIFLETTSSSQIGSHFHRFPYSIARGPFANNQQWLTWRELDIREEYARSWKPYIESLIKLFINLSEMEDELIWYLNPSGDYKTKVGYRAFA